MKPKSKEDAPTQFEIQEDAWYANNCEGNIEDYDGSEE